MELSGKGLFGRQGRDAGDEVVNETERYKWRAFDTGIIATLTGKPVVETIHDGVGEDGGVSNGDRPAGIADYVCRRQGEQ